MGKSSPQQPALPDPAKTASAQTGTNIQTAIANAAIGNADTYGPQGSTKYNQIGEQTITGADGQVYKVPKYSQTTTLSPEQQQLYNQQTALGGKMNKLFTAVRPEMLTGGSVSFAIGVDVDFVSVTPVGILNTPAITGMVWTWTWPGTWGGQNTFDAQWHSVGSFGTWASMHMVGVVNGAGCSINAFDFGAQKQTGTWYG